MNDLDKSIRLAASAFIHGDDDAFVLPLNVAETIVTAAAGYEHDGPGWLCKDAVCEAWEGNR